MSKLFFRFFFSSLKDKSVFFIDFEDNLWVNTNRANFSDFFSSNYLHNRKRGNIKLKERCWVSFKKIQGQNYTAGIVLY